MLKYDYPCLLEGTPDADPVEGFCPPSNAKRIVKRAHSAFLRTDFEETLRSDRVTRLVLSGVFIQGCVGLTAADAAQRDFEVTLVEDAIGHGSVNERAPFFNWLLEDYELDLMTTEEFF